MVILFWTSLFLLFFSYVLFPLFVLLLSKFYSITHSYYPSSDDFPSVTILIAAHNEQNIIQQKIQSILENDFPLNKIEIIVGSDCSTDNTNSIVRQLSKGFACIRLIEFTARQGKSAVINQLITQASHEIVILTDANIIFSKNTIRNLMQHFRNDQIGLVDTNMINIGIKKDGISEQEKTYIGAEVKIKHAEGKLFGTLMGPFGGCYAIRKKLFFPIPKKFLVDDFFVCLTVLKKGFFAINDLNAIVYEQASNLLSEEMRRKRRIATGNFQNLFYFKYLLNPFRKIGFVFISHKVIRWLGPILLLTLLLSNYMLITDHFLFKISFFLQIVIYLLPIFDYFLRLIGVHLLILRFVTHFLGMNIALLLGLSDFCFKKNTGIWLPTKRN